MEQVKAEFFNILKAAIHKAPMPCPQKGMEEALALHLINQNLAAVAYECLEQGDMLKEFPVFKQKMKQQTVETAVQFYRLLSFLREWNGRLQEKQIHYYILKGFGLSSLYPEEGMRCMSDIDIYIPDAEEFCQAEQMFADCGYRCASKESGHHKEYYCEYQQDIIKCELHHQLVDHVGDKKVSKYIEETVRKELAGSCVQEQVMDVEFPVLPPTINLWYLILHVLHHFMGFGIGVAPLCDIVLFLEQKGDQVEWRKLEQYFSKSNMTEFAKTVLYLSKSLLGVSVQAEYAGRERKELAGELLDDLWEYDQQTGAQKRTPINLEKNPLLSYMKVCHRQMKYHFPKASGIVLLWPLLWLITIVRVLYYAKTGAMDRMDVVMEQNRKRRTLARKMLRKGQG